jgi:hypothetical protein
MTILIFTLISVPVAKENDVLVKETISRNSIFKPLYENAYPDFKQSQTIRYAVKWGSFGLLPAAFFGRFEMIGSPSILTSVIAAPVLGAIGSFYGREYGKKLSKIKSADPGFVSKLYTFGHEISYDNFFVSENKDFGLDSFTKYSITMQKRTNSFFIPEEFRLGYSYNLWNYWYGEKEPLTEYELWENRYNIDMLFNSSGKVFQIHYGIGAGYSWGELNVIVYETVSSENKRGMFFYPLLGVTINMYDFMYFRGEAKYELSGINSEISDYIDNPETEYLILSFSFGTYLF